MTTVPAGPTCPTAPRIRHMPHLPRDRRRLRVVFNPLRVDDPDAARATVAQVCRHHGWDEPVWIETTETETCEKQAPGGRRRRRRGASLGGDGTVRAVASALVGGEVALGLLPGGTGNLLARNLDLPVGSPATAGRAAPRPCAADLELPQRAHGRLDGALPHVRRDGPADPADLAATPAHRGLRHGAVPGRLRPPVPRHAPPERHRRRPWPAVSCVRRWPGTTTTCAATSRSSA
jgi:hypothetical protein